MGLGEDLTDPSGHNMMHALEAGSEVGARTRIFILASAYAPGALRTPHTCERNVLHGCLEL